MNESSAEVRKLRPPPPPSPPLKADPGVTALAGQVLDQDDRPLRGVYLRINEVTARTDGLGRFQLRP